MNWMLSTLLLLALVFAVVQSQSYIEVDENGDEYEVKKFHIQGRQLNNNHPQCVVTRRKRSPDESRQYSLDQTLTPIDGIDEPVSQDIKDVAEAEEEAEVTITEDLDDEDDEDQLPILVNDNGEIEIVEDAEPSQNQSFFIDDLKDTDFTLISNNNKDNKKDVNKVQAKPVLNENESKQPEMAKPVEETKKPIKQTLQKVTLLRPQEPEPQQTVPIVEAQPIMLAQQHSVQLLPQSLLSNTAGDNFFIIEAPNPLANPVQSLSAAFNVLPSNDNYPDKNNLMPFTWAYSTQPATTTAIWSTGDDSNNSVLNNGNEIAGDNGEDHNNKRRPSKKGNKKRQQNKTRKTKRRPTLSTNKKRRTNRRPTSRPNRKNNKRKQSVNNRRKPVTRTTKRPTNVQRRPSKNQMQQPNKKVTTIRDGQKQKTKRKSRPNKPGAITTTSTLTTTTTGNDANIDCIIINKEQSSTSSSTSTSTTTSTTPRPFWNILGRNAANSGNSRDFGNRKRVLLRFTS